VTASGVPGTPSAPGHSGPGVACLEGLLEIVDPVEAVDRVVVLLDEHAEVDQGEHDLAQVTGSRDPPVFEYRAGHEAPALKRQIAAAHRELGAADVPWLTEPLYREVQGRQDEEIRRLVVRRVAP